MRLYHSSSLRNDKVKEGEEKKDKDSPDGDSLKDMLKKLQQGDDKDESGGKKRDPEVDVNEFVGLMR